MPNLFAALQAIRRTFREHKVPTEGIVITVPRDLFDDYIDGATEYVSFVEAPTDELTDKRQNGIYHIDLLVVPAPREE